MMKFLTVIFFSFLFLLPSAPHGTTVLYSQERYPDLEKYEKNYIYMTQELKSLEANGTREKIINYLTNYVNLHPEDPFNAYYLYIAGEKYLDSGAIPFAIHYYHRIITNFRDVEVKGESIRFKCLEKVLKYSESTEDQIQCIKSLITEFSTDIDAGQLYFQLGELYEKSSRWQDAVLAYKKFLTCHDTSISNSTGTTEYARDFIDYYNSKVTWSNRDLNKLVSDITAAMNNARNTGSVRELKKYMSGVKFFMTSWEDADSSTEFITAENLAKFLNSRVKVNSELDKLSNFQEAYLRTTGWEYRINTWYFYFRKINFPANPEIHESWEWAGIYLGDRIFSKSNE